MAFEKYKPWGLFLKFYGIFQNVKTFIAKPSVGVKGQQCELREISQ